MNEVQKLVHYKQWADHLFLATVETLSEHELLAPRAIFFGSLIRTLNHAYAMDLVWQSHLLGTPHGLTTRNPETHPPMAELAAAQRALNQWYVSYADALSERQLAQRVEFEFIGGGAGVMSRAEILLHVVNHTTYHRGHAADILYQIPVSPPTTDFPVFLRELANIH